MYTCTILTRHMLEEGLVHGLGDGGDPGVRRGRGGGAPQKIDTEWCDTGNLWLKKINDCIKDSLKS